MPDDPIPAAAVKAAIRAHDKTYISREAQMHATLLAALPHLSAREAKMAEALQEVLSWAQRRCPCENEKPNPCPLCGADVNQPGDYCKAVEAVFPTAVLRIVRAALKKETPDGR